MLPSSKAAKEMEVLSLGWTKLCMSLTVMPGSARVAFTCRCARDRPALLNGVKPIRHDAFYQPNCCGDLAG